MQYSSVTFRFSFDQSFAADLFIDRLAQIGFDSFEENDNTTVAYIPTQQLDMKILNNIIAEFPYQGITIVERQDIEDRDWNEEWEKNYFQPIIIDNRCIIHSTFHTDIPQLPYNIIINPQMAFGTGHHQTTSMMLRAILDHDFTDKQVLDMGCGTAVLGILARLKGAKDVTAIDIDDWCVRNANDNILLNNIDHIKVKHGDASLLYDLHFDIILANINRNILINDMPLYAATLSKGGFLYMSGFYTDDIPVLTQRAEQLGFTLSQQYNNDNWAMIILQKQ